MRHGSLFSGIGGFDLAAEWMGWENIFHCEWMPFPRKVLNYYWPNAKNYEDITKTDFTIHRGTIDILTGGFPCQPYSSAGKRLGKEDERQEYALEDGKLERGRFGQSYQRGFWNTFPSQSPICGGDDGLPTELDRITFSKWRAESIKGYGNAIVPQVAHQIFKVIQHMEDVRTNQLTIFDAIQKEN